MPCILKVHIGAARGLPINPRHNILPDAYVEVCFGSLDAQVTSVSRNTNEPIWLEDIRFEIVDDSLLQEEPLELKVLDCGEISDGGSIGAVSIDLNPHVQRALFSSLLREENVGKISQTNGRLNPSTARLTWYPIYDTIRGMRGELGVELRVEFLEGSAEGCVGLDVAVYAGSSPYSVCHPKVCKLIDQVFVYFHQLHTKFSRQNF